MGGGRRPALPPVAIQAGAGREGEGGRKAGEARPAGTAACTPAKRGAGMSWGRFGAGRSAGWHRALKVETRNAVLGRPLGVGGGVLVCLLAQKYESYRLEGFQKKMYRERPRGVGATLGALDTRGVRSRGAGAR